MNKQTRFIACLCLLLMGGAVNAHAQMGQPVHDPGGSRPPTNNGDVNTKVGGGGELPAGGLDAATGVLEAAPAKLTGFSTVSGKPSAARQFTVSGYVATAELKAPQGFELSLQQAGVFSPSLSVGSLPATVWVRLTGSKPNGAASISGDVSISSANEQTHASMTAKMRVEGVVD